MTCAVVAAGGLLGSACGHGGDTVARVGERTISRDEFERLFARQETKPDSSLVAQREEFLASLVDKELLVLAARERGLFDAAPVVAQAQRFEDDLLRRGYQGRVAKLDTVVTDEELRSFFEDTRHEVLLRHIIHWSRAVVDSARRRIEAGEDFAAVASEVTIDPRSAPRGGLLPWLHSHQLLPEFRAALAGLEVGELAGPFESPFGFHLIRLEEQRERQAADFEAERTRLQDGIRDERRRDAALALQAELRQRYDFALDRDAVVEVVRRAKVLLTNAPARARMDSLQGARDGGVVTDTTKTLPPPAELWSASTMDFDQPLATYDDARITVADYREGLLARGPFIYQRLNPGAALADTRNIFFGRAMVLEARRLGIDREPAIRRRLRLKREEIAVTELYQRAVLDSIEVTDEDVRRFYDTHTGDFQRGEKVRYAYLRVADASVAQALVDELADVSWTRFDSLRAELRDSGQLLDGRRDSGYLDANTLPEEVVAAARTMQPREVGHTIWPQDQSHLVFVLIEFQPDRPLTFEEARAGARSSVRALRSEQRLQALLAELRGRFPVESFPERLGMAGS